MTKGESQAWARGYVTAVANGMRAHHDVNTARDTIRGVIGHGPEGLRAALLRDGAEEFDLKAIDPAFRGTAEYLEREWFGEGGEHE